MGNKKGRDDPSLKQALLNSPGLDAEADSTAVANKNISKLKGNHPNTKATSKSKGKRNKKTVLAPSEPPEKESLLEDDVNANSGWEEFPMDEKSDSLSALPSPSEEISRFQSKGSFVADTPSLESDPEDIVAEAPPSELQDLHHSEDTSLHLSSSGVLTPVPKSPKLNEGQEAEKDDVVHKKRAPLPIQISKAALAEPKIDHGSVPGITSSKKDFSVQEIPKGEPMGLPSEYDITIIHAAQSGNTIALEYILDKDPSKVNEKDSGDCSPLHWAAINNRIEAARFLLKNGADVDAQGGDLKATPLHWACRQGLLDMMVLLLEFGADPTLMDSQGFNIVHLSIHSFNFMSLIYSLSLPGLEVDVADGQGHTPLMWAAYQGFSQAVELLLKFKADVHARDNTNYTSLHWGVVKGDEGIIQKLIVAHADLMAVDNQGQTPSDLAIVSKTEAAWQAALIATGHDPADLSKPSKRWTAARVKRVALVLPVPLMSMIMLTIVYAPWEMALPMVTLQLWLFYHFGIKKLLKKCSPALCLQESPYHVGIFLTTVIFTFKTYLSTVAPNTFSDYRWTNMIFSSLFAASLYFYWLVTTSDPGFLPRYNTLSDRKELLQSLAQDGRLTLRHFCTSCLAQRPIRSKHCRFCNRCVARFDHHCPWNFNCVGAVNHREFVLFTLNLALGIILFEYLGSTFLSTLPINYSASQLPCILNEKACTYFQQQPFLMFTLIWNGLQLFWLAMVVGYQLYLVAKSTTTNESINHDKYSYFVSAPDQSTHRRPSALTRLASYIHPRAGHVTPRSQFRNPFDRGVVTNCLSFWLRRPSPTYWYHLYDTPPEIVCDENPYTSVPLNELGPTNDLDRPEEIELIDDQFMDSSLFPSTKADILSNARH